MFLINFLVGIGRLNDSFPGTGSIPSHFENDSLDYDTYFSNNLLILTLSNSSYTCGKYKKDLNLLLGECNRKIVATIIKILF
jgi:hypothetical protein